jgi:CBS domain-containing protein
MDDASVPGAPVVDERRLFVGVARRRWRADGSPDDGLENVGRFADPSAPTVTSGDHLDAALESLLLARANWIPVLDDDRQVVGIVTVSTLVRGYRAALRGHLRRVSEVAPNTVVVDRDIDAGSPLDGVALRDAHLPPGTIVMNLQRDSELVPCRGDTTLLAGDRVGILAHAEDADAVARLLERADGWLERQGSAATPQDT